MPLPAYVFLPNFPYYFFIIVVRIVFLPFSSDVIAGYVGVSGFCQDVSEPCPQVLNIFSVWHLGHFLCCEFPHVVSFVIVKAFVVG